MEIVGPFPGLKSSNMILSLKPVVFFMASIAVELTIFPTLATIC